MDEDLRELERAAARGEPGARRALLVARLRAGRLDDERVAYAAALGDDDARALLGESAPERLGLLAWLEAVRHEPWGPSVGLAAAVAAARASLPTFADRHPEDRGPQRCIDAAQAVLDCPCDAHRHAAMALATSESRALLDRSRRAGGPRLPPEVRAAQVALFAATAAGRRPGETELAQLAVSSAIAEARRICEPRRFPGQVKRTLSALVLGC